MGKRRRGGPAHAATALAAHRPARDAGAEANLPFEQLLARFIQSSGTLAGPCWKTRIRKCFVSMKLLHTLALASRGGGVAPWSGFRTPRDSTLVTAPPPAAPTAAAAPTVVRVNQPTNMPAGTNRYVVEQTPPAPSAPEVIPAGPSEQHGWLPEYGTWQKSRCEWMAGHWETPPRCGATRVDPRWSPENGAYRFYEWYWN